MTVAVTPPTVYLGFNANPRCCGVLVDGPRAVAPEDAPAILVGFPYLAKFLKVRPRIRMRDWMMDSGAFSAWNSGATIDLDAYIGACRDLLATDPLLVEVVALDVIGDWRASVRNVEAMWRAGVPAIPVYHLGEPEDVLMHYAASSAKVGIGGVYLLKSREAKRRYVEQVFARVWPKALHAFAVSTLDVLMMAPWHSCDATSWETGPGRFGRWRAYGGASLGIRGSHHDLRVEVAHYLEMERLARHRWRRALAVL